MLATGTSTYSKFTCNYRRLIYLWTGRTRPRVAKQVAVMSARGVERLTTRLPAGVGHEPRVARRVPLLPAPTEIVAGRLLLLVLFATLGAAPAELRLVRRALQRLAQQVDAVLGPFLNARQVEARVAT
jgi:hypothetical protein